ncbi:nucleoid-associated protein [Halomarina ordinaria]|uniref:Nucleoid-associated protein n=1 Tax=Halomarina ordinaria TaxID=3033939 RepID=A0ABD5UD27_9EURY|nr:nucleoid-associated protein [Halomarina sp. PSRA2]
MPIIINAIAYSPVKHDIESGDDEDWIESTRTVDIDEDVIDIFRKYLVRVISKEDNSRVGLGHFPDESSGTQERLNRVLELDLALDGDNGDYDAFESIAETFKKRLINEMDGRTSSGVLFTIHANKDGTDVVGILKLDLDDEERSRLDPDTRHLAYEELEGVLPPVESFQKGCTYPLIGSDEFYLDGDVKFLQEDSDSDYFEDFLGCITSSASLEQSQNILTAVDDLKREKEGTGLSPDDIQTFRTSILGTDGGIVENTDVHEASRAVLNDSYDEDEVDDALYGAGESEVQIDVNNAPSTVVYKIDGGDIKVEIPMSLVNSDRVDVIEPSNDDGECVITVRGTSLQRDYQK